MRRTLLSATGALVVAILAAGCSGAGSIKDTYNDADLRYSKSIISSHQRALILSDIAAGKSNNRTVLQVARNAETQAEISILSGYMKAWGEAGDPSYDPTVHTAEADEPLIRGKNEVDALTALTGVEFDRAFLQTTVAHNREYIEHSIRQMDIGYDDLIVALARSIATERRLDNAGIESALGD
jgi:uncharacterized protein (DUF305 family)